MTEEITTRLLLCGHPNTEERVRVPVGHWYLQDGEIVTLIGDKLQVATLATRFRAVHWDSGIVYHNSNAPELIRLRDNFVSCNRLEIGVGPELLVYLVKEKRLARYWASSQMGLRFVKGFPGIFRHGNIEVKKPDRKGPITQLWTRELRAGGFGGPSGKRIALPLIQQTLKRRNKIKVDKDVIKQFNNPPEVIRPPLLKDGEIPKALLGPVEALDGLKKRFTGYGYPPEEIRAALLAVTKRSLDVLCNL